MEKKRGLGCFGCGCLVLVVLVLLIGALAIGIGYFTYSKLGSLTSATPASVPTFDGGDDVYKTATQKLTVFSQAIDQGKPATLELTADELNTLIARDSDFSANQIHLFFTLTGNHADAQLSASTNLIPGGLIKDRYINGDVDFTPGFDPDNKSLTLTLHSLKYNDTQVPQGSLGGMQTEVTSLVNTQVERSPEASKIFEHAKTVEVRDGKLEIETQ